MIYNPTREERQMFQFGNVLSKSCGIYEHYMIVVEFGYVVHASKKKNAVVKEHWSEVCGDKKIRNHGKWGSLSNAEIIQRADREIGKPYNLISENCEHLVRKISGVNVISPQVIGIGAILVGGIWLYNRSKAA